jgi:hypothetical protein
MTGCKSMNVTKQIFGVILTLLIIPALVTNAYAHTSVYELGYKVGKRDAISSISNSIGGCKGIANIATQQEIDTCHQGYNDAYNQFCGIHGRAHSEYPCDDHTHTLAYIIGYNGALQDEGNGLNNPTGDCSTGTLGDNATHQQIEKCLQGYKDSYNYFCGIHGRAHSEYPCRIKYSVTSFSTSTLLTIAYGIGYEYGKLGGDTSGDCDYSFMGDNTTQQQMDRCKQGISDAYNHFCVRGIPHEKSQCSEE